MSKHSNATEKSVLEKVKVDRRGFVRSLTLGTAFTVPLIATYSMDGLRVSMARAGFFEASNQNYGLFDFIRRLIHGVFRAFHHGAPPPP